jgi:hypothetical protein
MSGRRATDLIAVKLLSNFATSEELCTTWAKLCKVGNTWNSIQITDRDDADYFCVINHPRAGDFYRPDRTIVLKMEERESSRPYFPPEWVDVDHRDFFYVFDERNSLEWHLSKTCSELLATPIAKSKTLSSVTSSEYRLEGHVKRIEFLRFLEENGVGFDLYGRDNKFSFTSYVRALPLHQKDDGILPYKYTIAAESVSADGYFTEKIVDAILGECVCFYWGCPDLESYIAPDAFIRLDLDDFDHSLTIVEEAMGNGEWEKRIGVIKEVKRKILTEMQMMPVIESIIQGCIRSPTRRAGVPSTSGT